MVAEILSKDGASEADRIKAVQLLSNIASAGHTYKQMIGELDGIKAICDFIRLAKTDAAHELSRGLLVSLGRSSKRSEALHMYLVELLMVDEPQVSNLQKFCTVVGLRLRVWGSGDRRATGEQSTGDAALFSLAARKSTFFTSSTTRTQRAFFCFQNLARVERG